jgi:hypothetical protein
MDEAEEMQTLCDEVYDNFETLKTYIRQKDKNLFERWKAGGFIIDFDIVSMYHTLSECIEQIAERESEEETDTET